MKNHCTWKELINTSSPIVITLASEGKIQILWGLKLIQFWGPSLKKKSAKLQKQYEV